MQAPFGCQFSGRLLHQSQLNIWLLLNRVVPAGPNIACISDKPTGISWNLSSVWLDIDIGRMHTGWFFFSPWKSLLQGRKTQLEYVECEFMCVWHKCILLARSEIYSAHYNALTPRNMATVWAFGAFSAKDSSSECASKVCFCRDT